VGSGQHIRRLSGRTRVESLCERRDGLAVSATLGASAFTAILAATILAGFGGASFQLVLATWFTSHTVGMVIFATLTVVSRSLRWDLLGRLGHRTEFMLVMIFTTAITFAVFAQSRYPLLFLVYLPLLLCAYRHRFAGAVIGSTIVVVISITATLAGYGPLSLIPNAVMMERVFLLQLFIVSASLLTLPVVTALTERGYLTYRLGESERRLRAITDNLPAFVTHVDTLECYTFANAYMGKMMGVDPATLIGRSMRDVLGTAVYDEIRPHVEAALHGKGVTFEMERNFVDLHYHFQTTYVPDLDTDGKVIGFYVLIFDISQLKRAEQELTLLARHDSLTGLPNRLCFNEHIKTALARQRRNLRPLALLYLDIDRFKEINDTMGHAGGDSVLREFALRLKGNLREADFMARLGGDEFIVLLEEVATPEIAQLVARKLIAAMQRDFAVDGLELHVTISIGIAYCTRPAPGQDELIQLADTALYQAKVAGRNTYRITMVGDATTS
jgi:diguanylate cyclase (GGDEF)-like protein/PAS domain S-box-containing protein